jgi:predicted GTPase
MDLRSASPGGRPPGPPDSASTGGQPPGPPGRPMSRRVLIMGAAGRDFHNFNVVYRDSDSHEVVAFTATQIPFIEERTYPAALAGPGYPDGIPIYPEKDLDRLIREMAVDDVVFGYSDVSHLTAWPA